MFTGIITDLGIVRSAEHRGDLRLTISCAYDMESVALGASIACSGACLTVVDKGPGWFAVDVSAETLSKTASGLWQKGANLNLERALRLGDELGGHLVTGHVDGLGTILAAEPQGDSTRLTVAVPRELGAALAPKGSVTLDGVSLTVNEVHDEGEETRFTINLIPHTAQHTTLGQLAPGRQLNVEIDVLARYLQRMIEARGGR